MQIEQEQNKNRSIIIGQCLSDYNVFNTWYWNGHLICMFSQLINCWSRRVWRYQRGNQHRQHNDQKEKDKEWSTKHTHKTTDRVTQTPLKTGGELMYSGRVSSFSSTSGTHHANLVTNSVTSHEWGKDRDMFMTSGTWSFVTQIFHNGQPSHGVATSDHKCSKVMIST